MGSGRMELKGVGDKLLSGNYVTSVKSKNRSSLSLGKSLLYWITFMLRYNIST